MRRPTMGEAATIVTDDPIVLSKQLIQGLPDEVAALHNQVLQNLKHVCLLTLPLFVSLMGPTVYVGISFFQASLDVSSDIDSLKAGYGGHHPVPTIRLSLTTDYCQFESGDRLDQCNILEKHYNHFAQLQTGGVTSVGALIGCLFALISLSYLYRLAFSKEAYWKLATFNPLTHHAVFADENALQNNRSSVRLAELFVHGRSVLGPRFTQLPDVELTTTGQLPLPRPYGISLVASDVTAESKEPSPLPLDFPRRAGDRLWPPVSKDRKLSALKSVIAFYIQAQLGQPEVLNSDGQDQNLNTRLIETSQFLGNISQVDRGCYHIVERAWCKHTLVSQSPDEELIGRFQNQKEAPCVRVISLVSPALNDVCAARERGCYTELEGVENSPMMVLARPQLIQSHARDLENARSFIHHAAFLSVFGAFLFAFNSFLFGYLAHRDTTTDDFARLWGAEGCSDSVDLSYDCGDRGERGEFFSHSISYYGLSDFCHWVCGKHADVFDGDSVNDMVMGVLVVSLLALIVLMMAVPLSKISFSKELNALSEAQQTLFGKGGRVQAAEQASAMIERHEGSVSVDRFG